MQQLFLIGIGTGNPDHVTGEARRVMAAADLILIPRKGADKADLADLRRQIEEQLSKLGITRLAPEALITFYRRIFNGVFENAPGVFARGLFRS